MSIDHQLKALIINRRLSITGRNHWRLDICCKHFGGDASPMGKGEKTQVEGALSSVRRAKRNRGTHIFFLVEFNIKSSRMLLYI